MDALLVFIGALVVIVVGAVVVNRVRGVRAHYIEDWAPEPGEDRLLDDPRADFYVVPSLGQAKVMTFARRRRTPPWLPRARISIARTALLSRRHMITHVLLLRDDAPDVAQLGRMTGGQYTTGYVVMSARPEHMTVEADGAKAYLRIVPEP